MWEWKFLRSLKSESFVMTISLIFQLIFALDVKIKAEVTSKSLEPRTGGSVEHRAVVMREVAGSNPGQINTHDLKITEEKVLPLYSRITTINRRPCLENIFYVDKFSVGR